MYQRNLLERLQHRHDHSHAANDVIVLYLAESLRNITEVIERVRTENELRTGFLNGFFSVLLVDPPLGYALQEDGRVVEIVPDYREHFFCSPLR